MGKAFRILALVFMLAGASWAAEPEVLTLNADRVSFSDETGQATAEGSAVLNYQGTTIQAERIDYDAVNMKVNAMPLPGDKITLTREGRTLRGDNLEYDLETQEGVLNGAASRVPIGEDGGVLYVYGGEINVIPWALAQERGLVKSSPEEFVIQWRNVALTTCTQDHPHYRLESKNVSFIPGQKVTAHKPRIYLGKTYLFTSPFDYVMRLGERSGLQYSFFPYIKNSDTKGSGGGFNGTIGWDTGELGLGLSYLDKAGFEFMLELYQRINSEWSIRVGVEHSWDDLWDERVWRPYASLFYSKNGWDMAINWSHNEYITDQKDTEHEYKGRLDRRPEIIIWAPWFRTFWQSWMRLNVTYGTFKEEMYQGVGEVTSRYGMGFRDYYELPLNRVGTFDFFTDTRGVSWFYDRNNADHEMLRSFLGFRYRIGSLELGTGYERQYTWGESPMHWDAYRNRERVHQKFRFPVGREIYLGLRGSYDLDEGMIDEVFYTIQWITDCMTWDLHYKDDRTSGGNNQLGLTLSLNALPDNTGTFGQESAIDPFVRPREIPKK